MQETEKAKRGRPTMNKPEVSSGFAQKELDKAEKQFDAFEQNLKDLSESRNAEFSKSVRSDDSERQTKLSQKEIERSKDVYLKPTKTIGPGIDPKSGKIEKFNERFRKDYEYMKEYVQFVAENKEIIGEKIEIWTKRFAGTNMEFWEVPVNTPVWGPRYLAEQIQKCAYNKFLQMDATSNRVISNDGNMTWTGPMVIDRKVQRLDAYPVRAGMRSDFR